MTRRAVQIAGTLVALCALLFLTLIAPLVTYLDFDLARSGKVVGGEVLAVSKNRTKSGFEYLARIEFDVDGKVYKLTLPVGPVRPTSQVAIRYAPRWPRYAVVGTRYPEPTQMAAVMRLLISLVFGLVSIVLVRRFGLKDGGTKLGESPSLDDPSIVDPPDDDSSAQPVKKASAG